MFEYKIENGILLNEKLDKIHDTFNIESKVSREDKIAFVDERYDGALSYLIALNDKFMAEKDSMPKDWFGDVKTVSLKAWLKKNDDRNLVDREYKHGELRFITKRHLGRINDKSAYYYDKHEDFVDETFHRVLKDCRVKERIYAKEHNDYCVLADKFMHEMSSGSFHTFGNRISYGTSGIFVVEGEDEKKRRPITLSEMKHIFALNKQVEEYVAKLTADNEPLKVDEPKGEMPDSATLALM